jgi:hypothetical protein
MDLNGKPRKPYAEEFNTIFADLGSLKLYLKCAEI